MTPERIEKHIEECDARSLGYDKRCAALESWREVVDGEIASLRASRHEFGNWLNRHNLEINALQQRVTESLLQRFTAFEKDMLEAHEQLKIHSMAIERLASDSRILAWKIGTIIGSLLFIANQIASRIHF